MDMTQHTEGREMNRLFYQIIALDSGLVLNDAAHAEGYRTRIAARAVVQALANEHNLDATIVVVLPEARVIDNAVDGETLGIDDNLVYEPVA